MKPELKYEEPSPPALQALGRIAVAHSFLDRILKMVIRDIEGLSLDEVLGLTNRWSSTKLRDRISCGAAIRLRANPEALDQFKAILSGAKQVSEKRNEMLHSVWGSDEHSIRMGSTDRGSFINLPNVDELNLMADHANSVAYSLLWARNGGFLAEALKRSG